MALSFKRRYHKVRDNLEVKEIALARGEPQRRFVPVHNPEKAEKDKATREKILERIKQTIEADDTRSADDPALSYKQLMELEGEFRTMKTTLELRPIFHRNDDRIRSRVLLCFLALILVRIAERETSETWDRNRSVMERLYLGELSSKEGCILRRTELTVEQVNILK